ncbi:DNA polymerase domain-containing protein [Natrialbaceae archaeon AArc-T1-2]|uniref:DNA polymerase domain-containing protein n=1 Tax=Natrialbaceae archaeon AArc-T1-2 TaxID=3053904 RepID=UPI00255A8B3D|nr:DNA polymerase domain-containing protein [Natrialbaceae archaeon AArc-T1-2]WIV67620.1 DNA polymerase domain-containing protein [Natrialbaceae archaeon AArc-T1-2]
MTDEGQTGLDEFTGPDDRLIEEAQHVAGNGGGVGYDVVDPIEETLPEANGECELAVMQVDYTIAGYGDDERPIMHVFGRTTDDDLEHVQVVGFRPYFYAPTETLERPPEEAYDRITGSRELDHDGEPYESIRGENLTKIFGQTPRDVGQVRDDFEHYEADVLFPNRFLIDKDVRSGIRVPERRAEDGSLVVPHEEVEAAEVDADPRVLTFDIEVDDRSGFPEDGEEPIVCLTSHDSYRDEYVVWLYDAPDGDGPIPEDLAGYEPIEGEIDREVRTFTEEEAMLEAFLDYVDDVDVDVLTGWNFEDFDAPYFLDRLEELNGPHHDYDLEPDRLSRVNEVWRSGWGGPDVKGRVVFDLLYGYQRMVFSELDSYRLDAVGEQELGVGKERYPGDIGDLWEDDPERLLEYNLRDVELCVELDRQQEIIPFWDEVRSFVGCKLEDAPTPGDAVDMYVLHEAHGRFVLPSKGQQEGGEEYEGGAVFEPITGVKENVTVLDLKCFSGDTELLTPDGPKNIKDLEVSDDVYTLDPDTFECEITPVAETHEYENRFDRLHHLSGNTHDLKVTENHRFLVSNTRGWDGLEPDDFEFLEYRDIPETDRFAFPNHEPMPGATPETFDLYEDVAGGHVVVYTDDDLRSFRHRVPDAVESSLDLVHGSSAAMGIEKAVGKYLVPLSVFREHEAAVRSHAADVFLKYGKKHRETPLSFEMADWLEFLGWYVTEGSLDRGNDRLTIHQSNGPHRDRIRSLLDRMGINYTVDQRGINVSNRYLFEWLEDNCGNGYATKCLPEWVFTLDADYLSGLLETMIDGDGERAESGLGKFWTKSDHLMRAVSRLAVRCGHKPTVSKQKDGTWYVSVGKRGSFKKSSNATVESHDGNVYCVTTAENHVVLAGRGGNFQWVGQSLYPMCMTTVNASPETKVDPDAYDGETFVAPTEPEPTHFRKEPDGVNREMITELLAEREEKKALRNEHEPGTPEYEQYDRQQGAVKVIMNCFTPDTNVLTPDGVCGITDLEVGDEVYSLDPETLQMEVKPVVETHTYPDYDGELVDIETSKIDFRVTPNHRMLVRKNETNGITDDEYRFVEAGDLDRATNYELPHDWDGPEGEDLEDVDLTEFVAGEYEVWVRPSVHGHTFTAELGWTPRRVPKADVGEVGYVFTAAEFEEHRDYIEEVCETSYIHRESGRKWIPRTYDGDDVLQLLAWYVTEGNVYTSDRKEFGENVRGSSTTVKVAQDRPAVADGGVDHHASIGDLLERMELDYYVDDQSYQFTSKLLGDFLEDCCGGDSFEKRIPEFVFDRSRRQKRLFLETLVDGDGDRQVNSWRYSTASERLRDDVLRLCAHLGLTANYSRDSGSWRIYVTEASKNTLRMHRSGSRSQAENGVYCVTVEDNHTLLAGRNGTFQFVGQSLYGVSGWEQFRLYDKEAAAAITATGREVIEFTETAAEELDYQVAYGDTDSVMLELDSDVAVDDAIEQSFDIEEYVNGRYDDFAREELNAAEHRFQIEFEKLYRRFFQAGKKKRYAGHIVWKEGKEVDDIDITGFEYQRSDIAPITKEVQHQVIETVVTEGDVEAVKAYVNGVIEEFQAGEVSLEEIAIPGGIGKRLDDYDTDTAQVRGAKYANLLLGTNVQRGSKPKRLYLERVDPGYFERVEDERGLDPRTDPLYGSFKRDPDVICFEYEDQIPEAFEVDYDKMLEKTLKGPIERILEALDVSWEEVESGQEQTGLDSFM